MKFKLIVITLLFTVLGFAQTKGTIKGVVTDKDLNNEPLPFANVVVKGQNIAVNTDENGSFSIAIVPGEYILEFSFLGYENATEKVIVKENYDGTEYLAQGVVSSINKSTGAVTVSSSKYSPI